MCVASATEPSFTKRFLPTKQDELTLLWGWSSLTVPRQTSVASASLLKFVSESIVTWKFVKECWSLLRCSRVLRAVNLPEGCWWGCFSDITPKDVWRKDIWGTADITWHRPTSQLVSDFFEGCENVLYQLKVQGRLWRKRLYSSREKWVNCFLLHQAWAYSWSLVVSIVTVVCAVQAKRKGNWVSPAPDF